MRKRPLEALLRRVDEMNDGPIVREEGGRKNYRINN